MNELFSLIGVTDWIPQFALVLLRASGVVVFLPIFGSLQVPVRIRVGFAVVMAMAMMSVVEADISAPTTVLGWMLVSLRELAAGFFFGIAARTIFSGVELAASLVSGQSGFSMASMVDPLTGGNAVAPALFLNLLATALFLAADMHHLMIGAVLSSYDILPVSTDLVRVAHLGEAASSLGMRMLDIAVQLAAPGLLVTFSIDLLLALVGRAMGQVPILFVGYPVKLAAGLIAMAMLAMGTGSAIGWLGRTIVQDGRAILGALSSQGV